MVYIENQIIDSKTEKFLSAKINQKNLILFEKMTGNYVLQNFDK